MAPSINRGASVGVSPIERWSGPVRDGGSRRIRATMTGAASAFVSLRRMSPSVWPHARRCGIRPESRTSTWQPLDRDELEIAAVRPHVRPHGFDGFDNDLEALILGGGIVGWRGRLPGRSR